MNLIIFLIIAGIILLIPAYTLNQKLNSIRCPKCNKLAQQSWFHWDFKKWKFWYNGYCYQCGRIFNIEKDD